VLTDVGVRYPNCVAIFPCRDSFLQNCDMLSDCFSTHELNDMQLFNYRFDHL